MKDDLRLFGFGDGGEDGETKGEAILFKYDSRRY